MMVGLRDLDPKDDIMRPSSFILACTVVFAMAAVAYADYEVRINVTSGADQKIREQTVWIKGTRVRTDLGDGASLITDQKNGSRIRLNEKTKTATDFSDLDKALAARKEAATLRPKPMPSGKKAMVNGYEAQEYTYTPDANTKISLWAASGYPKEKASALKEMYGVSSTQASLGAPDLGGLPGPVIRYVMSGKNGALSVASEVKSIVATTLDEKEFEIPADYKVKKFSGLPAAVPLKNNRIRA
jgi:uncharacterized protein DUF4412